MGLSYEESKKVVFKGMILLGVVTIVEVLIALLGNGHLISGFTMPKWIIYPVMIGLSAYKAYFIIYEFMHLRYEVKGMALSILLPTLLLVWGIIAFLQEGNSWGNRRALIEDKNAREVMQVSQPESPVKEDTKEITE
jgi:cytochrome c oxidase subunit IV